MTKKIIFLIILIIFPFTHTKAEVYKFFEYMPDIGVKFNLTPNVSYIQKFIPFNDHLSLITILINNTSTNRANMFLDLYDFNNNLIERKNISVPYLPYRRTGNAFNIPLSRNYQITSGREYKFSIYTNEDNNIEILGFNLIDLLQHTESNIYLPETIKPLIINNQETEQALKFALHEGNENVPPVISNVTTSIDFENKLAIIKFNSNEPIRYQFTYWTNDDSTSTKEINYFETCPENIRSCQINLDVFLNKEYYFNLIAYDYWLNSSSVYGNFNTYIENNQEKNNENNSTYKNIKETNKDEYLNTNQNNIKESEKKQINLEKENEVEKKPVDKKIIENKLIKEKEIKNKAEITEKETKLEEIINKENEEEIKNKKITEEQNKINETNNEKIYTTGSYKINNNTKTQEKNYLKIFSLVILLLIIIDIIILIFHKKKKK